MSWSADKLISIRRKLHEIPEIGLKEFKTHDNLLTILNELPQEKLEIVTNETAIIVRVKGKNSSKKIGWRTDIDGLPISEETGLSYSSKFPGYMHACGHDIHMTIALGLIERAVNEELINDRIFLFQPAEENMSGAQIYYDNGFFKEENITEIFGLHVAPHLKSHVIGCLNGTLFASCCRFVITIKGKEGHAAFPHEANDTIVASASFIQQVQSIISRNVNPMESAVISFGEINGGTADNIIAGKTTLTGTIRALTHEINELTQQRMKEIAEGVALSFGCSVTVELDQKGYVPVVNDTEMTKDFIDFMKKQSDVIYEDVSEMMTGEDFGYLLSKIPGTMFWLGVASEQGLHHSEFNPDENTIEPAVEKIHRFLMHRDKQ